MSSSPSFHEKLQSAGQGLAYLPRALSLIWQSAPGLALGWIALLLVQGLLPALNISLTRLLVNRLVDLLARGPFPAGIPWELLNPVALLAGGIALLMLLSQLLQSLGGLVHTAQVERVGLRVSALIQDKASQADYSLFETPELTDKLHRARAEAAYRPVAVLDILGALMQGVVTLVAMLALLLPYGTWLIAVLAVSSLPVLWVVVRSRQKTYAWQKSISSTERRAWYYDWLLISEDAAAELRLFGAAPLFSQAYREIRARLRQERMSLERSQALGHLAAGLIGMLAAGACMAVMAWRALQGAGSLGDLVLFYQVINQGQSAMRALLQNVGQLYGSLLFLSNLFEFLDLEKQVVDPAQPVSMPDRPESVTLRCEALGFTYPGSAREALSGLNLTLPAGQIVAIVGDNGAGKSTLLKLICRLYDPQSGRITWNGTDLRDFAQQELRSRITVLFQQPMHYQASARENIAYSTAGQAAPGSGRGPDAEAVATAAAEAGADGFIRQLPEGYETRLGKLFEHGTDLSVGEWQRIALARAFYRQAPLMLLDEPTSAMDAWSEMEWLARLRRLSQGRTTLIITHRLTTAMQADIIHVMVDGCIIESGTHAELVALDGRYAQAWRAQTRQEDSIDLNHAAGSPGR